MNTKIDNNSDKLQNNTNQDRFIWRLNLPVVDIGPIRDLSEKFRDSNMY